MTAERSPASGFPIEASARESTQTIRFPPPDLATRSQAGHLLTPSRHQQYPGSGADPRMLTTQVSKALAFYSGVGPDTKNRPLDQEAG